MLEWKVKRMQQNKMTRKQAIEQFAKIYSSGHDLSVRWIDFFIETGMLQVEEEKTIKQTLNNVGYNGESLLETLDKLGLKIVEK